MAIAACLGIGSTALAAPQQVPEGPRSVPLETPAQAADTDRILADVLRAYRSGPVAERVTIRVVQAPPPDAHGPVLDRSSAAVVRVRRGSADQPPVLRADLGVLGVYARADDFVAVRSDDPSVCVRRHLSAPVSGRALASILPPLALPQIELALGDEAAAMNLTPYTRGLRWYAAEDPSPEAGRIRLSGRSEGGIAMLEIDAASSRVRLFSYRAASQALLEVRCEPMDPGDPDDWAIDADDRRVVRSIRDLGVPEGVVAAGDPVPDLPLHDLDTDVWDLGSAFRARAAASPHRPPAPAILVLTRQRSSKDPVGSAPGANAAAGVRAFLRKLRRLAADRPDSGVRFGVPFWRPVLVFEVEEFSRRRLVAAAAEWDASRPVTSSPFDDTEPDCLWSSAGRPLLGRFVRGAETVVVVIAPDNTLMGAFGVRTSDEVESVTANLTELVEREERSRDLGPRDPG